jgi:gliding motility-associated-like protein
MWKSIFLFLSLSAVISVSGQITINNTLYTPTQLVDGVLIPTGSGVTVSNVTFSGVYNNSNRYQVGHFTTATTTLTQMGFASGIVLSTGNTSDIPLTLGSNPQAAAQMSTGYTSCTAGEIRESGTCPTIINDVNILAGTENYFNAAILEFDFVPVGDVVQFRYIFGSEEFTDNSGLINYQCSSFNDQFGFLISGPGIAGGQGFSNNARNIARLANGSQVCINAVNNGVVGSSGGSPSASQCQAANPAWIQGTPSAEYLGTIDGTELNGNTIILTAEQSGLTPGQTYHIKLVITDVNDAAYDAVVYLEAGSFTTVACTDPDAPTTGSITQPNCTTPSGSVQLNNLPSSGNWTVTASPSGVTLNGTGTSTTFLGLNPSQSYTFTVTNEAGCTSIASNSVTIVALPTNPTAPIIGTITQPTCAIPTGSVALSGLPSSGTWTISLSPTGTSITNSGSTFDINNLSSGTYTLTVTDNLGCVSPASMPITIDPQPTTPDAPIISNIVQPTCSVITGSIELTNLPSGNWVITSTPGSTINGSGASYMFTGLAANSSFTYNVTNDEGCTSPSSTQATLNPAPANPTAPVIGNITQPTCAVPEGSVELSGLPNDGQWIVTVNPGGTTLNGSGTTGIVTDLISGNYTFTVTDENGCTSSVSANATLNNIPAPPSIPNGTVLLQPTCTEPTGSIDVNSPVGANLQYSIDGVTYQSSTTFTGLNPGTYTISVLDNTTGCSSVGVTVLIIESVPSPEAISVDPDLTITLGESTQLTATGNGTISWDNGQNGNTITVNPTANTTYCATLTDANGCTNTDCISVTVESPAIVCGELFIPTAFSPNGDNNNSSFGVSINPDCVESLDLKVYDRWGELIFQSSDPSLRWDGTFKSKELDPAVFTYVVRIKTTEMTQEQTFKGNVTLMK